LIDSMNEELIDEIIGQTVDIYKISVENKLCGCSIGVCGSAPPPLPPLAPCICGTEKVE